MATERPIFILGCPRSGMTLLRLMLRAHIHASRSHRRPASCWSAYEDRGAYGDLREIANRPALAEWIVAGAGTRFGELGLDPRAVARDRRRPTDAGLGRRRSSCARTHAGWASHAGATSGPAYVQHIDALPRLFPDAQIVHVIRDGRDCVAALKRSPWWRMGDLPRDRDLDPGHRRRPSRRPPPATDSYIETQYEHLMADPEGELRRPVRVPRRRSTHRRWRTPRRHRRSGATVARRASAAPAPGTLGARTLRDGDDRPPAGVRLRTDADGPPVAHHLARYATVTTHRRLAARKRTLLDLRHPSRRAPRGGVRLTAAAEA